MSLFKSPSAITDLIRNVLVIEIGYIIDLFQTPGRKLELPFPISALGWTLETSTGLIEMLLISFGSTPKENWSWLASFYLLNTPKMKRLTILFRVTIESMKILSKLFSSLFLLENTTECVAEWPRYSRIFLMKIYMKSPRIGLLVSSKKLLLMTICPFYLVSLPIKNLLENTRLTEKI